MALLHNIHHDVSLHNTTIYAQWASFCAIVACCLRGTWVLVMLFQYYQWISFSHFVMQFLNVFLFPVAPVTVIMPYISKYNSQFFWTGLIWWLLLPFWWIFTMITTTTIATDLGPPLVLAIIGDMFIFIFTILVVAAPHKPRRVFSFHLGFACWSSLWVGMPRFLNDGLLGPHFEWTTVFAVLATALYIVAIWRRDDIVFSKTLGGPGVEPMSLTLHSSEPEYNAITNEGRIRLA